MKIIKWFENLFKEQEKRIAPVHRKKIIVRGGVYKCKSCGGSMWVVGETLHCHAELITYGYTCDQCNNKITAFDGAQGSWIRCEYTDRQERERRLDKDGPADYYR